MFIYVWLYIYIWLYVYDAKYDNTYICILSVHLYIDMFWYIIYMIIYIYVFIYIYLYMYVIHIAHRCLMYAGATSWRIASRVGLVPCPRCDGSMVDDQRWFSPVWKTWWFSIANWANREEKSRGFLIARIYCRRMRLSRRPSGKQTSGKLLRLVY